MAKTKPNLSEMIPDNIRAFAEGARVPSPVPQAQEEAPQEAPVEATPADPTPAPQSTAPVTQFVREGKTQVQLRLPPSVQARLRRMAFERSEMSPSRVTVQELLEKAVMQFLEREEQKPGV